MTAYVKGPKGKADRLFSQLIRARGRCEARDWPLWRPEHQCAGPLETCHILSRRYAHTRCDPDNAVCLCSAAHRYFTANPLDWAAFVGWLRGEAFADELRRRRDQPGKVKWEDVVARLQTLTAGL